MAIDPVSLAITLALTAVQMAMTASQRFEGQRLDSTDVTTAEYGTPIPRFWGLYRNTGCSIIWAEKLKEKKTTSKTKGGKFDEYKYYGTWAIIVADHEIDAIRRLWLDKHLVYQVKDAGPISPLLGDSATIDNGDLDRTVKMRRGANMRIYLGTEDQEPDPRYLEWCEDRYGPDSATAFKGQAVIFFVDIPLEKFGNRIPQVDVEAISTKAAAFAYESKASAATVSGLCFASDFSRFWSAPEAWDVPSRTKLFANTLGGAIIGRDGTLWQLSGLLGSTLTGYSSDGFATSVTIAHGNYVDEIFCPGDSVCLRPYAAVFSQAHYVDGADVITVDLAFSPTFYFADADGDIWAVGRPYLGTTVHFYNLTTTATFSFASPTGGDGVVSAMDNGSGQFFCHQDSDTLFLVDKVTGALVSTTTISASIGNPARAIRYVKPGATSVWIHSKEYSTTTMALLRTVTFTDWLAQDVNHAIYDPINHALICEPFGGGALVWRYLDRVSPATVTLSEVVADVAGWCGVTSVDASDLDQQLIGYSVVQGSGRDMVEPLLTAFDCDARPHDFTIEFVKRGSTPTGATLLTGEFTAGDGTRFNVAIAQDTDLPRRVTVNFADGGKDHQNNNVASTRPLDVMDSRREQPIDMTTFVSTPALMQPLADRYLRRQWGDRETIELGLTAQQLALEPADTRTISLDGVERIVRIDRITLSAGGMKIAAVRDHPSLATLSTGEGATMDGRDADVIYIPGPTKVMVIDMPLAQDGDDSSTPQVYYGAGRYLAGGSWPGAAIYIADVDGDEFRQWNEVSAADAMTWGYATGVLASADPWLWDRGNSVNVQLFGGGTVTSVTEAAIDADRTLNLARMGGEWIQFASAVLESDGSYTLSAFKRGRRGTEGEVAAHAIGDEFVLAAALARDGIGLSEVGTSERFKGTTIAREVGAAPTIAMTFTGATLKPYAPCHFRATRDSVSGDWSFSWVRRTRLGGAWVGGTTIPLSEASEAYELVIPTAAGSRTIAATSATATWTAAMQTADYGSGQSSLPAAIAVYQLSDAVGRGFASEQPIAA